MDPEKKHPSSTTSRRENRPDAAPAHHFATTAWSVVVKAGEKQCPESQQAMETLCRDYWYPLYAYLRRKGLASHEAEELTQAFFVHLLERNRLGTADPLKGRFRSFLLTSLNHFMIQDWRKKNALKRGGGVQTLPIDFANADQRYSHEPAESLTAEKLFARKWALQILQQVLDQLQVHYQERGRSELFEALKPRLVSDDSGPLRNVANQLGMNEITVKVAAHRMREKYRTLLIQTVSQTVENPDDIRQEIQDLFDALSEN